MNYVVPSGTLRNLKSISVGSNSCYDHIRSKPFACQCLIVPSLYLEVSSINQNPIVNVKLSSFCNTQGASFMVDMLEDVVDMVVHCSHSIELFFCGGRGEFVVVIEVYGAWVKPIETSVWRESVGSDGCSIIGKFCKG